MLHKRHLLLVADLVIPVSKPTDNKTITIVGFGEIYTIVPILYTSLYIYLTLNSTDSKLRDIICPQNGDIRCIAMICCVQQCAGISSDEIYFFFTVCTTGNK